MDHSSDALHEDRETLWLLTFPPAIWFSHFLLCYATASVWCAKFAADGSLGGAHLAIGFYTVLALAGILAVGVAGFRRHRHGSSQPPHDFDSTADRHRFLGYATLLLSGLSFVATGYVAMAASLFGSCR